MSEENKFDPMLLNLILTFQAAGMQHLGKLKNPMSDNIERNLVQAELTIDMLDMLKKKTDGNLTEEESNLLNRTINELKMNFMDEKEKSDTEAAEEAETDKSDATAGAAETDKSEATETVGATGTDDEAEKADETVEATETAGATGSDDEEKKDEKESSDDGS